MSNLPTNTAALYKRVYGRPGIGMDMTSPMMLFSKIFPLASNATKIGRGYEVPILVGNEGGSTGGAAGGSYTLNAAKSLAIESAYVQTISRTERGALSYDEINSASKAAQGGVESFANYSKLKMSHIANSARYHQELGYRWGCGQTANDAADSYENLGEVESTTSVSSGVYDVTLTRKSWCRAIWFRREGHAVDIRSTGGAARMTTAATIVSVNSAARTIRLSGVNGELATIVANDHLFWTGTGASPVTDYENQMVGMAKILTNTTGTIHGIDASAYEVWRGNQFNAGGSALTFATVSQALTQAIELGVEDEFEVLTSPASWTDLMTDQAAQVLQENGVKSEYALGARGLKLNVGGIAATFRQDIFQKLGTTMVLPKNSIKRVGAEADGTFDPDNSGKVLRNPGGVAGSEVHFYVDDAVMCETPFAGTFIHNIDPTTSTTA